MSLRARLEEAKLALMLLTRLPAGRLAEPAPAMGAAAWAFPLVGLVVGLIGAGAHWAALALGLGPVLAALLALAAMVLATGALHLDGLADFADGMGGGRDRAHVLEIMRDSRIGSYGVIALVLVLGAMAAVLARLPAERVLPSLLLAAVASRLAMLMVLDLLAPARADGLGRMAMGAGKGAWVPGALVAAALALWLGPAALAGLAAGGLAALWVARIARARIGGQTGDVLGASQVAAELGCLLGLAAALG